MTILQPIEKCYFKPSQCSYAYLMRTWQNGMPILKVGKSDSPNQRLSQLNKRYNRAYYLVKVWEFDNPEDAYEMEIWLHRFYKAKTYKMIGQDHFFNCIPYVEDMIILDKKAKEIQKNSKEWLDKIK